MFRAPSTGYGAGQQGVLVEAAGWVQGLLLGSVGTAIAILAVAGFGFALLQGRLSPRQGLKVVLGCFILFGAPAIADGLAGLARWSDSTSPAAIDLPPPPPADLPGPPPRDPDPYAGASVPM